MAVPDTLAPISMAERWLARLAYLSALAAVTVLVIGGAKSVGVLAIGVAGLATVLIGGWWYLSRRGIARGLGALVAFAAPVTVIAVYLVQDLVLPIVLVAILMLTALGAARAALVRGSPSGGMPERTTPRPQRPFVIMNPRSGDGKVARFGLEAKATALGAQVALIAGPEHVDVAALARDAVTAGADLLGVAGGDGTQALVAGIAADHDVPFLVISAGTRNHFAMDLGLDREHPQLGFDALTDGVEITLDLGTVGGRTFVNNASFGVYADIVQSPAYRADKRGTTLQMLPDLLSGQRGPRLVVRIDNEVTVDGPKAILISNNPYQLRDPAGLGRRARLDRGVLGVIAITVDSAAQAAALLRVRRHDGLHTYNAHEVIIDADAEQIPVGIDGESVLLPTPVRCHIRPGALRVRVPRVRLHPPDLPPGIDLTQLRRQALATSRVGVRGHPLRD
jgi:diacylglycerol kinase family enzyme